MKSLFVSIVLTVFAMSSIQSQTLDQLTYKIRPSKGANQNPPLLILLHGVGSNEESMHQLALHVDSEFLVVSARGPFVSGPNSYRWYDVDFSTGKPVINAEEAKESTQILLDFVSSLKNELKFNKEQVVIGGFSQGGIMSYELGLNNPEMFKATVSLSGRMMVSTMGKLEKKNLEGTQTLIIHGYADNVLPIQYAEQANSLILSRGGEVTMQRLHIDHSISGETLQILNSWLARVK